MEVSNFITSFTSQGMIMLILATDMARHSEILESFKSKLDNFDFKNDDHLNSVSNFHFKILDFYVQWRIYGGRTRRGRPIGPKFL